MLIKPEKYDEVQVNQDFERIELGGHKGIIKKVEQYTNIQTGNTSLKVEVDTAADDKQPNYFQEQYDNDTRTDRKWSNAGTKYVSLKDDENCVKMLKAFITAVENSNANFTYNWAGEETQLIGKKVGLVFGLEEYEDQEGKLKTASKITQFRSIDKIDSVKIPKVKLLNGTLVEYEKYSAPTTSNKVEEDFEDTVEITDDILD